jgi:hypothetical protein
MKGGISPTLKENNSYYKNVKTCNFRSFVCFMVFNATFNNISVISWQSVLLVEETGGNAPFHAK